MALTAAAKRRQRRYYWRHRDRLLAAERARRAAVRERRPRVRPNWGAALADDIDQMMVDRLVAGTRPTGYTTYERCAAVAILDARRVPRAEIARIIGVGSKQVYRDLARLGITCGVARAA